MQKTSITKSFLITFTLFYHLICVSQNKILPSIKNVISLSEVSETNISPDGLYVAYLKQSTNWKDNTTDSRLWLSKEKQKPFQITDNDDGNIYSPKWSPNSNWIAYLSDKTGRQQIYAINIRETEIIQVTNTSKNIISFEWAPSGDKIGFIQSEEELDKKLKDRTGDFSIIDEDYELNQLWTINFNSNNAKENQEAKPQLLIHSKHFTINKFKWNPNEDKIAFEHQPKPSLDNLFLNDISIYDLETKKHKVLIANKSYDALIGWSPDGKSILYQTCLDNDTTNFTLNRKLYRIDLDESNPSQLAENFDEDLEKLVWNTKGIFGLAWQKTKRRLIKIDPNSGVTEIVGLKSERVWDFSFSKTNNLISYTGVDDHNLNEVHQTKFPLKSNKQESQLTNSSNQISNWILDQREIITWTNTNGDTIEGVLHKPVNFNSNKKYPLLVIIHGGPMFLSYPELTPQYVYPMLQWVNKGAVVLRINYTGSTGYGEKFRTKNIQKLGTIDSQDILEGIQFLENKGFIDSDRIGCMGWSHGGFLSATLLTTSNKFKAFSIGAGIANWTTQYAQTDLKQFNEQYLGGNPWNSNAAYYATSPISKITKAHTPTLIQHCKFDNRVPISNSYELYAALKSLGVENRFIIYNVYNHGIYSPKEKLAANQHNWEWFLKHIWNEDLVVE